MASKYLTPRQIAEELSISVDQAKKLITSGELPVIDVGVGSRAFWRVSRTDLDDWLEQQREANARRFKYWAELGDLRL